MSPKTSKTPSGIHPGSLVDCSTHSPASLELYDMKMTPYLIEYTVDCVLETVHYALGRPSSSRVPPRFRTSERTNFLKFVTEVVTKAEVRVPVLLVAVIYVHRAQPHLDIATEEWANERTFLGALILANKYLNDSTLKNVHWAMASKVFRTRDISRIEQEFLTVLDFELGISEGDILFHHAVLKSYVDSQEPTTPVTNVSSPSPSHAVPFPNRTTTWSDSESTLGSEPSTSRLPSLQSPRPSHTEQNTVLHPTLMSFLTTDREGSPIPHRHSRNTKVHDEHSNDLNTQPTQPTASKPSHHRRLSSITSAFNALRSIPVSIPYFTSRTSGSWRSGSSTSSSPADSDSSSSSTHTPSESESEPNASAAVPSLDGLARRMGGEFLRPILINH
ncbi:hypothetical protein QCA50_003689 [Cerrena zonata]|uniref:Cyclin N-terminal domain-containing protein n=1 Tax=Cerrena zonata TaxID=2478898 RepID=A0AAW0GUI5_9APHY